MTIWAYNKSMLKREGQPDPWDLWLNGEWAYALEESRWQ